MDTQFESVEYALSPAKSRSLFIAALLIALLGLTMLDVGPEASMHKRHEGEERSIDCIVASAVFAGVNTSETSALR